MNDFSTEIGQFDIRSNRDINLAKDVFKTLKPSTKILD